MQHKEKRIFYRHPLCGFIGINSGAKEKDEFVIVDGETYIMIRWFTNMYHKNLYTNLRCKIPMYFPSTFTKENHIIKRYHKLPRKLLKKVKFYAFH